MDVEALVRRDRIVVAAGLTGITLLAWLHLFHMARRMGGLSMDAAMPGMAAGAAFRDVLLTFAMWAVMMVGMMLPSAAPMVLIFAGINRRRAASGGVSVPAGLFVAGYLIVWTAFSLLAAVAQWGFQRLAAVSADTLTATPVLGGAILMLAGIYQFTPLKSACLSQCQSPLGFVLNQWREGAPGAVVMGLCHGMFCLGCCWTLMALLFVAGVMNLLWVAAIAAFVLVEKLVPAGRLVSYTAGGLLIACGLWVLARAF